MDHPSFILPDNYQREIQNFPVYHYPYIDLGKKLADKGESTLTLFVYGSLIDKTSASRTLSLESLKSYRPAIAFGFRRIFNLDLPSESLSHWQLPDQPEFRAFLNVQPTQNPKEILNGVLIDIVLSDLNPLLERETGYDLVPVLVTDWNELHSGKFPFQVGYILQVPLDSCLLSKTIYPRQGYYELVKGAAAYFGLEYMQMWLNSTFLGDEHTCIRDWEP